MYRKYYRDTGADDIVPDGDEGEDDEEREGVDEASDATEGATAPQAPRVLCDSDDAGERAFHATMTWSRLP